MRRAFRLKIIACFLLITMVSNILCVNYAYALTSGPSQPEITQFQPIGITEMVDPFTGDFGYELPLIELPGPNGGYPFNLTYQSGVSMEQDASWVGLGWNVNAGSIVRNMRGVPDDFNGDTIVSKVHRADDVTTGITALVDLKFSPLASSKNIDFTVSPALSFYTNSRKGVGMTIDLGLGFTVVKNSSKVKGLSFGFDFSFDSQGVGVNANVGYQTNRSNAYSNYSGSLGVGYHTTSGLNMMTSFARSRTEKKDNDAFAFSGTTSISFATNSFSPSIGFETKGVVQSLQFLMGKKLSKLSIMAGFKGFSNTSRVVSDSKNIGSYGYNYLQNQISEKNIMDFTRGTDPIIRSTTPNLGSPQLTYDYYNVNAHGIAGVFRPYRNEIGGVHEISAQSESGGGSLGGEIGIGNTALGDVGHFAVNVLVNYTKESSGDWDDDISLKVPSNGVNSKFIYRDKQSKGPHKSENVSFKYQGDQSLISSADLNAIGGEKAVSFIIQNSKATDILKTSNNSSISLSSDFLISRRTRNNNVQHLYNKDVLSQKLSNLSVVSPDYDVKYYNGVTNNQYTTPTSSLVSTRSKHLHHFAGFTSLSPNGSRYNYTLPAYNHIEETIGFSPKYDGGFSCEQNVVLIDTTAPYEDISFKFQPNEQVIDKRSTPSYAHSFLLTSILGTDYVDLDNIAGPSDGDLGYWVKFNYNKITSNYRWRTPFVDANLSANNLSTKLDDVASFMWGEKEIWYLATAETKTHIIVFEISPRKDGYGAKSIFNSSNFQVRDLSNPLYKLDKIKLYSKSEYILSPSTAVPLQTVHFEYDYSLCPGIPTNEPGDDFNKNVRGENVNMENAGGKLTLKKIYTTYKNDHSGRLHAYRFSYADNGLTNYAYNPYKLDRWGTFKPINYQDDCDYSDFSYTDQFNQITNNSGYQEIQYCTNQQTHFDSLSNAATSWNLTRIELPSGGKIEVDYEMDDYAYVQHKKATQMFKILGLGFMRENQNLNDTIFADHKVDDISGFSNPLRRRVYFQLENPIPTSIGQVNANRMIYSKYIKSLKKSNGKYQSFVSAYTKIVGSINERIDAYYDLEIDSSNTLSPDNWSFGVASKTAIMDNRNCGGGVNTHYTVGYITLDKATLDGDIVTDYHPIALNAWNFMKISLPQVMFSGQSYTSQSANPNFNNATQALVSIFTQIGAMFSGYRKYCNDRSFADKINLSKSWIKMGVPDGRKYGGGCRVKQIKITDDVLYANSSEDFVGQYYDYTMEEDGNIISSGVASYEPIKGGDENTLKGAKIYKANIPMESENDLFFEYPINESFYPAPQIGYRKVTIKSLNTERYIDKIKTEPFSVEGIYPTGVTVKEFYTAKEFPTLTDETPLEFRDPSFIIPIPFIGTITDSRYEGSQGYSIILNDMHGKPKSESSYAVYKNGDISETPLSSIKYNYQSEPIIYEGESVFALNSQVTILTDDPSVRGEFDCNLGNKSGSDGICTQQKLKGVDFEFFYDTRQTLVESGSGGLVFNIDVKVAAPFFEFIPWPNFSASTIKVNTIVANKIIHKAGVLKETIAFDGQSTVVQRNEIYDAESGLPVLVKVTNNFDEYLAKYSTPGHLVHSSMKPAYHNWGLEFDATQISQVDLANQMYSLREFEVRNPYRTGGGFTLDTLYSYLEEGDEFIVEIVNSSTHAIKEKFRSTLVTKLETDGYKGGCNSFKLLRFQGLIPEYPDGNTYWRYKLVRSGKRNMQSVNLGEITGKASTIRQRNVENLDTLLISGFQSQVAAFLNSILDENGILALGRHSLSDAYFFNEDGEPLFPILQTVASSIIISNNCNGDNRTCSSSSSSTIPLRLGGYQWLCKNPASNELNPSQCVNIDCSAPIDENDESMVQLREEYCYLAYLPEEDSSSIEECGGDICSSCSSEVVDHQCGASTPSRTGATLCAPDYVHYTGYHMTIQFKPFTNLGCLSFHCIAKYVKTDGELNQILSFEWDGNRLVSNAEGVSTEACLPLPTIEIARKIHWVDYILQTSTTYWGNTWKPYLLNATQKANAKNNPYAYGLKGIWRPTWNYYYKDNRLQEDNNLVAIRNDGYFDGNKNGNVYDVRYYLFNWMFDLARPNHGNWLVNEKMTKYNESGYTVEMKDILGIYASSLYDATQSLQLAVGANMKEREMLYVNFDNNTLGTGTLTANIGFTGKKSLSLTGTDSVQTADLPLTLTPGKAYHLSVWAGGFSQNFGSWSQVNMANLMNVRVLFFDASNTPLTYIENGIGKPFKNFAPTGLVYEGQNGGFWRRIDGSFIVPVNTAYIQIRFMPSQSSYATPIQAYYDDLRIHPELGNMKTYVYNPSDFRLIAVGDENNFPTIYGYQPSGELNVVKKLTERGFKTIQESINHIKRTP